MSRKKKKSILGFEHRSEPLLSPVAFTQRLIASFAATLLLIALSLFGGMLGYHYFESMAWIDAYANAAMILSGMGPLTPVNTWGGKLFAGLYAMYSGLALIVAAGIILAPMVHRLLHRFHLEAGEDRVSN